MLICAATFPGSYYASCKTRSGNDIYLLFKDHSNLCEKWEIDQNVILVQLSIPRAFLFLKKNLEKLKIKSSHHECLISLTWQSRVWYIFTCNNFKCWKYWQYGHFESKTWLKSDTAPHKAYRLALQCWIKGLLRFWRFNQSWLPVVCVEFPQSPCDSMGCLQMHCFLSTFQSCRLFGH